MRKYLAPSIATVVALLAPVSANADNDVQLWTQATAAYELSDPLELKLNGIFRLQNDVSEVQNAALEFEPQYRFNDYFELAGGYRLSNRRNNDGDIEQRHRLYIDLKPRLDVGPVRLGYRLRLQHSIRPGQDRDEFRNQFELSLRNLDPVEPFAAFELRHRVGDGQGTRLRALRYTAGADLELSKSHEIGAYFRVETPEEDPDDPTEIIFGLDYAITF